MPLPWVFRAGDGFLSLHLQAVPLPYDHAKVAKAEVEVRVTGWGSVMGAGVELQSTKALGQGKPVFCRGYVSWENSVWLPVWLVCGHIAAGTQQDASTHSTLAVSITQQLQALELPSHPTQLPVAYPISALTYPPNAVTYPTTTLAYPPNAVTYPTTTLAYPPNAVMYRTAALTYPPNAVTYPTAALTYPPTAVTYPTAALTYPPTAVTYPTAALTYAPTAVTYPTTTLTYPPTAVTYPTAALTYPPTAVTYPATALAYPPTAVTYPPPPQKFSGWCTKERHSIRTLVECVGERVMCSTTSPQGTIIASDGSDD